MMQWDDRKGKYIKDVIIKDIIDEQLTPSKRIKIIRWLYFDGRKLYWDIPKPSSDVENASLLWKNKYKNTRGYKIHLRLKRYNKMQKYLNKILSALPYIPLTGLILGVII